MYDKTPEVDPLSVACIMICLAASQAPTLVECVYWNSLILFRVNQHISMLLTWAKLRQW